MTLVTNAAAFSERHGRETAFREFRKSNSKWFHDDTHLFAYDMDLNVLLNPAFPEREGRNLSDQRDSAGKAVHEEMRGRAETRAVCLASQLKETAQAARLQALINSNGEEILGRGR